MKYAKVKSGAYINLTMAVGVGVHKVQFGNGAWEVIIQLRWCEEAKEGPNACTWADGFATQEDANTWLQLKMQEVLL